jgi:hypothetical protein
MPPKLHGVARQTERGKPVKLRESNVLGRELQPGRWWLEQFADWSVRANFAEVQLIRCIKNGRKLARPKLAPRPPALII